MKKFFVLFMIPAGVIDEWKKNTDPEKMKAASQDMMTAWQKWLSDNAKHIVERGGPLGKTKRATANGIADARNDLNWYMIVQAESHEAAAGIFAKQPQLQIPQAAIEIMEMPEPRGM